MEHIAEEENLRADKFVEKLYKNVSYSFLQKIFREKRVLINGKKAKASDRLQSGNVVRIYADISALQGEIPPEKQHRRGQKLADQFKKMIIFENEDIIAINKPTKLATQLGSKLSVCVETFMKAYDGNCKLVHRLDKDTSGVLLIAKNQKTAVKLSEMFRENKINKTYLAVVDGKIKTSGVIDNFLEKSMISGEEKICVVTSGGKRAITGYRPIKSIPPYCTILELKPKTGRKHQLRAHCAEVLKAPILGDNKYNKNSCHKELHLHAFKIEIKELEIEIMAPLPCYFPKI